MMRSLRAAAVQMVSSTDPETNIATMKRLVRDAAEQGADWVLLPEYWPLMGKNDTDKLAFAEPLDDGRVGETCHTRFQTALSETARECGVVLFGGTVPLQSPDAGKVMNTMLVYDRDGNRVGLYHKMHLFGFSGLSERYAEADTILAGNDVPKLSVDDVPLAAGVCYDCRFPEFSVPSSRLMFCCCRPRLPTRPARRIGNCCCAPVRWKTNATSLRRHKADCMKAAAAHSATV